MEQIINTRNEILNNCQGKLLVLTGFTASGKDTLMNRLLESGAVDHQLMSYTTRPPRQGEIDGVDYNFLRNDAFEGMLAKDEFFQYRQVESPKGTYYYGNKREDIYEVLNGKNVVWRLSIDVAAKAEELIASKFKPEVASMILPQLHKVFINVERLTVCKDRARKRSHMPNDELVNRLRSEYNDYLKYRSQFDLTVTNSDLDTAYEEIYQTLIQNE